MEFVSGASDGLGGLVLPGWNAPDSCPEISRKYFSDFLVLACSDRRFLSHPRFILPVWKVGVMPRFRSMSRSMLGRRNWSAWESEIARLRSRQVELIRRLDRFQVDTAQGARTMGDWTSARLDVSSQTASRLTQIAHHPDSEIDRAMAEGRWGLDRAAALTKLRTAGIDPDQFTEVAEKYSLGRLYGLLDRLRHHSPTDEADVFADRYLVIQPNLDESVYQLWGRLPGVDGRIVEKALSARETELPVLPHQGQGQRRADALTTICLDSLTGTSGEEGERGRAVTVAEVFIDGTLAAETYGETGAGIATGPRVGPNTLSEILCDGKIRVIVTDGLHPVAYPIWERPSPCH